MAGRIAGMPPHLRCVLVDDSADDEFWVVLVRRLMWSFVGIWSWCFSLVLQMGVFAVVFTMPVMVINAFD